MCNNIDLIHVYTLGIRSPVDCTDQLKVPVLIPKTGDGVFALMDGGRYPDAPEALRKMLAGILIDELASDKEEEKAGFTNTDPLQYISHTFLTAHRYVI